MREGRFVVIEGLDGSGKGLQTNLLIERLKKEGYDVEKSDFPQYGNWSAAFVERYLRGEFGSAKEVSAKQASLFYALDRYAASFQIKQWLQQGKIVISNRYTSANKGHQLGKIKDPEARKEFLSWLNKLEYDVLKIPVPHKTIFLHMKPEIGQRLVDMKAAREYTNGQKRDIHEADINHLRDAEDAYLHCLEHDTHENWYHIVCHQDNEPRPISEIHEDIYSIVTNIINK
ncbi:thymidylate kinase [Candidatus Woesearchaeota archaeon CG_4_10_14_0_2_um_filter_33_13]|nr:MAG: thymidylate kinase [Candidatus Woesearchaeota archaeon CG_4_10_14_0_2_um_filter_33_13]